VHNSIGLIRLFIVICVLLPYAFLLTRLLKCVLLIMSWRSLSSLGDTFFDVFNHSRYGQDDIRISRDQCMRL